MAVWFVADPVIARNAHRIVITTQYPGTQCMEGAQPHSLDAVSDELLHAMSHLARRLVRERDSAYLVGAHAARRDHVGDAVREHTRLAAPRTGEDQQWSVRRLHGFALRGVEALEEFCEARCGAPSRRSGAEWRLRAARDGRVIRVGAPVGEQMVARGSFARTFDVVEIDIRDQQFGRVFARRSSDRPAVGANDDRGAEECDAALDPDAIRTRHHDAVLRGRRHGDVVALAISTLVPYGRL